MILFCLPYAGGSEAAYYSWKKYLDEEIKLHPIKLKGRGRRICEDFYNNIKEAVDDIFYSIKDIIKDEEYAIYGHSMGSVLGYELYYKIVKEKCNIPKHMFFSGQAAPGIKAVTDKISQLPDDLFMNEVVKLGGTPKEVLESKELLDIIIPILRSDFKMLEECTYEKRSENISCNITVFNGLKDKYTKEQIEAWKNTTDGHCEIYNFNGDHFFINNNTEEILNIINNTLLK